MTGDFASDWQHSWTEIEGRFWEIYGASFYIAQQSCDHKVMKQIYIAANLPDAHLVRNMLEQAGIPAHIFNANAIGALGDLPMSAAYPQVWIAQIHQEQHARSVVAEYSRATPPLDAKACSRCGEANPGEFELCWSCGAELLS